MKPIILDVDTGIGALALIFALRLGELKVEAVTTVAGNVVLNLLTSPYKWCKKSAGGAEPVSQSC